MICFATSLCPFAGQNVTKKEFIFAFIYQYRLSYVSHFDQYKSENVDVQ